MTSFLWAIFEQMQHNDLVLQVLILSKILPATLESIRNIHQVSLLIFSEFKGIY